jgi:hypothetical protein
MPRNGHQKYCVKIEEALATGPRTCMQLVEELGIANVTAWRWLQVLVETHKAYVDRKVVHPNGGPLVAVYVAGRRPVGHKVKEPKILDDIGRTRRYRKKMRESGDWQDTLARRRADYWKNKPAQRDLLTAALFGSLR